MKKLIDKAVEVGKLLLGVPVEKWVLLVPSHDSKDVNLHCSKKTLDLRSLNAGHLHSEFEVCVQDQSSFPGAALNTAMAALTNISLSVQAPTAQELDAWQVGSPDLLTNATKKLAKRTGLENVQPAVGAAVEVFLKGSAVTDALRASAPDLHDRITSAIAARAQRLRFAGPQGGPGADAILHAEISSLIAAIKEAAPSLSPTNAEEIALGVISDWIMRCPLDFKFDAA